MRERGTDKYENAHKQAVVIEFWKSREREPSASRTFARLNVLDYKSARQSRRESVRFQSVFCKVASNKSCLKISFKSRITNSCVRRISNKQLWL